MHLRIFLPITLLALLLTGCASTHHNQTVSADEITVLSAVYDYDAEKIEQGMLTDEESRLLDSYRALQDYLAEQYPGISYEVKLVTPQNPNSPTGSPYDTFYVVMGKDNEPSRFQLAESEGAYTVFTDDYSNESFSCPTEHLPQTLSN